MTLSSSCPTVSLSLLCLDAIPPRSRLVADDWVAPLTGLPGLSLVLIKYLVESLLYLHLLKSMLYCYMIRLMAR